MVVISFKGDYLYCQQRDGLEQCNALVSGCNVCDTLIGIEYLTSTRSIVSMESFVVQAITSPALDQRITQLRALSVPAYYSSLSRAKQGMTTATSCGISESREIFISIRLSKGNRQSFVSWYSRHKPRDNASSSRETEKLKMSRNDYLHPTCAPSHI